jgi:hypothetical protein
VIGTPTCGKPPLAKLELQWEETGRRLNSLSDECDIQRTDARGVSLLVHSRKLRLASPDYLDNTLRLLPVAHCSTIEYTLMLHAYTLSLLPNAMHNSGRAVLCCYVVCQSLCEPMTLPLLFWARTTIVCSRAELKLFKHGPELNFC